MSHELYCPIDFRRLGSAIGPVVYSGVVDRLPLECDRLEYHPCEVCRKAKRPHWHRFKILDSAAA